MKRFALIAAIGALSLPIHAQTIASVNGENISQESLDGFISLLVGQGATDSEELRAQVKQEMVHRLVAVQAAKKAGVDKKPEVRQEIELANQGILVRALMNQHLLDNPVTDAQIQSEYEDLKAEQTKQPEYKLRHILVKEEDKAKALIADIKSGKTSFEDAASQDSIDPGSGKNGGDLGWAPVKNYVPEFAQAVEELGKGKMSDKPVKSQFGWHIIDVQDSRPATFPELDEIQPQLEEMMRQERLARFQEELIKNASITQ